MHRNFNLIADAVGCALKFIFWLEICLGAWIQQTVEWINAHGWAVQWYFVLKMGNKFTCLRNCGSAMCVVRKEKRVHIIGWTSYRNLFTVVLGFWRQLIEIYCSQFDYYLSQFTFRIGMKNPNPSSMGARTTFSRTLGYLLASSIPTRYRVDAILFPKPIPLTLFLSRSYVDIFIAYFFAAIKSMCAPKGRTYMWQSVVRWMRCHWSCCATFAHICVRVRSTHLFSAALQSILIFYDSEKL